MFEAYRNQDGTYNGVAMMADMTGLSRVEVEWTAGRVAQLMVKEQRTRADAVAIVKEEAKGKPWEAAGA